MKWYKAIIYGVLAAAVSTLGAVAGTQARHLRDTRERCAEQSRVIDSLLTIRHNTVEVDLNVTDKSTSKVYGSHNKGTITMPSERTYRLVIDSCSVKIR
jgi:hypothetical protein